MPFDSGSKCITFYDSKGDGNQEEEGTRKIAECLGTSESPLSLSLLSNG